MTIYRVLLPTDASDPIDIAERASFHREGFCWPALLFGPAWLLARGLWRPLGAWCLGALVVALALRQGVLPGSGAAWLYILGAILLGLEGRDFVAAATERKGFRLVDIVAGSDDATAERAFFARWRPDAAPAPNVPARPNVPLAQPHVIGMFPEAGG
jgi:hypothetical protein